MSSAITHYQIVKNHIPEALAQKVEALINQDWQPLGGVCIAAPVQDEDIRPIYVQAMVKYKSA